LSTPPQLTASVAPWAERTGRSGALLSSFSKSHSHGGIHVLSCVCLEKIAQRLASGDEPGSVLLRHLQVGANGLAQTNVPQADRSGAHPPIGHLGAVDELLDEGERAGSGAARFGFTHVESSPVYAFDK